MRRLGNVYHDWRDRFAEAGIMVGGGDFPLPLPAGHLLVTNCSKTKGKSGDSAVPKDFYKGLSATTAITFAEANDLRYGVLSDLYGIHFDDESLPYYDLGPAQVTDKNKLASMLYAKCAGRGVTGVCYYNSSPCRARFYLDLLLRAGLRVVYYTRLRRGKGKGFGL